MRAQTTQDFAYGIAVFILALAITFSLVPNLLAPFQAPVGSEQTERANRVSAELLDDWRAPGQSNTVEASAVDGFFGSTDADDLRDEFGFDSTVQMNVSFRVDNSNVQYVGEPYEGQAVASALRVVRGYNGAIGSCDSPTHPTCRIVVRVW